MTLSSISKKSKSKDSSIAFEVLCSGSNLDQLLKAACARLKISSMLRFVFRFLLKFSDSPSYASASWFFKSRNLLLTGVAESIKTLVLTPSLITLFISFSYLVSLSLKASLFLKLCDSSITTKS